MIGLAISALKITILTAMVLVISQIPVGNRRICDHVHGALTHSRVQTTVQWVAKHFNFLAGMNPTGIAAGEHTAHASAKAASEHSDTDRERLSGLLKSPRK